MLELQDYIKMLSDFKSTFAQKYGIIKLGIFGSVARNENTENSDIDIVVEVKKPSLQLMYELKEALKQLFKCEVNLVRFRDSLRPLFKSNIQKDVIYVWLFASKTIQKCDFLPQKLSKNVIINITISSSNLW